ncbi:hypothetical protein QBC42DRAFT_254747 [Cladorrhinum samala]|uniref:Uncharacterized protein n=1 Tax=Cladorrhinum samala TaxID=585594 RepID=A0AAV9HDD0_9PEZI|nr:hypothetical protein QBC42DRAFT_254747 [Cladorrhinum samala]
MSADAAPTLFPNRPIRPLPKRRLRERLPPEVAESIEYPPVPQRISPLFSYNIPSVDESVSSGTGTGSALPREVVADLARQTRAIGLGSENDRAGNSAPRVNNSNRPQLDTSGRLLSSTPTLDQDDFAPLSYPSSPDGYDSFENANNKKKRKIPTAVEGGVHIANDSLLSAGLLNRAGQATEAQGQSSTPSSSPYYSPYYGSGSFGSGAQNVAGPGRGRYGRAKSGRSPLRTLSDSTNSWAGRNSKLRPGPWTPGSNESPGIISTAIANAEKLTRHQGQENISLLHQQLNTKRSEASTQFTFTCDSQVPVSWPGPDRRIALPPDQQQSAGIRQGKESWSRAPHSLHAGQPAPLMPQTVGMEAHEAVTKVGPGNHAQPPPPPPPPKGSRRSPTKEFLAAAKARRRERQLYNKRNPPKPEDIWICHFCEYEDIFGHPPEALVRSYEIKDRKQRQLEQQRRAQWERMKKGKHKGKKNSKLPTKNNNAVQDSQSLDSHGVPLNHYGQETQDDEFYDEDDYEEEDYEPDDEVHVACTAQVSGHHHHHHLHHHHHSHVQIQSGGSCAIHDGGGT